MFLRDSKGRFASKEWRYFIFKLKVAGSIIAFSAMLFVGSMSYHTYHSSFLSFTAEAWELPEVVRGDTTKLEAQLVDIVWGGESGHYVPVKGETLPTFDPSSSMYASCIKIGGRHPKDCLSYGPFQLKIGTVQHYAPEVYGREVSEREARDIAEGLDTARHFFVTCSVEVRGCVKNWTTAMTCPNGRKQCPWSEKVVKSEVQRLINEIRAVQGISIK